MRWVYQIEFVYSINSPLLTEYFQQWLLFAYVNERGINN